MTSVTLCHRVDQLTDANKRYQNENATSPAGSTNSPSSCAPTEHDLAAARTSIRPLLREHTSDLPNGTPSSPSGSGLLG